MLTPFLTKTPEKIFFQLGIEEEKLKSWESILSFGAIQKATVQKGEPLFPRLEVEEEVAYIKEKMQGSAPKVEEETVEIEETELPELGAEIAAKRAGHDVSTAQEALRDWLAT